jgi:PAS domain S-box-containing protein
MALSDDSVLHDQVRLQELHASGLLGATSPASFDRYTRLTARTLGVPIALITLVDADHLYIISGYGLPSPWNPPCELPLQATYCQRVVTTGQPLMLGDIRTQDLWVKPLHLEQIGIIAYASVPLQTESGQTLGTLCAIDYVPHDWSTVERENLEDLASAVVAQIVLSTTARERSRAEQFEIAKRRCLEELATGQPLNAILSVLAEGIETQLQPGRCAIMLLDPSSQQLVTAAAPSLPSAYSAQIDGLVIGPMAGSCGTAAYSGEVVVCSDIKTDPHWEPWCAVALSFGLQACLSVPFRSSAGNVIGTFAVYYPTPHTPRPPDLERIMEAANIAAVAIERWQTLDALRASQSNLTAIFEQATDSIYSIDQSKRLVMFNPIFAEHRRLSEMEPTPEFRPNGLFTATDLEFWSQHYDRALAGEQFHFEYQRTFAGSEYWHDVSMNPIRIDGSITGVLVVSRNITDRIQQEQQRLDFERAWLETQHLESLAVLAGGIAHDFNNLLATIQGNAGLALLDLPTHSPIRESLLQIDQAVEQSARLTRQLLAYAGKGRLSTQPIDLCLLIADMGRLISAALPQSVLVSYHLEPGLPLIDGDSAHLQQVVMNLIMNAAEAIEDDYGMVIISTHLLEVGAQPTPGANFEPTLAAGSYTLLEVRDNGSGMDAATQARIYEPFFTTKFTGRGLGLAAVQGIVRSHRGGLRVQSVLGQGTIFQVAFPCTRAVSVPTIAIPRKPAIAVAPPSGTILVIDDEPGVLQVATRLLERLGYTPLACADRQQALDLFRNANEQIRSILLDWTMPGLSGVEVIRGLRAIRADVPIVVMSGYSAHEISLPLETPDLNGFIQKPFRIHELREAIAQISAHS